MKRLILGMYCVFLSFPVTASQATDISLPLTKPKSETTRIQAVSTSHDLDGGELTCPEGSVMVGFLVSDDSSAYAIYDATRNLHTQCLGLGFDFENYKATVITNPSALTYTIYCKSVNLDFY